MRSKRRKIDNLIDLTVEENLTEQFDQEKERVEIIFNFVKFDGSDIRQRFLCSLSRRNIDIFIFEVLLLKIYKGYGWDSFDDETKRLVIDLLKNFRTLENMVRCFEDTKRVDSTIKRILKNEHKNWFSSILKPHLRKEEKMPRLNKYIKELIYCKLLNKRTTTSKRRIEQNFIKNYTNSMISLDYRGIEIPEDIMLLILSYIPKNKIYFDKIGCISECFYLLMLKSVEYIRINNKNVKTVPILVLQSVNSIEIDYFGLFKKDIIYLIQNIKRVRGIRIVTSNEDSKREPHFFRYITHSLKYCTTLYVYNLFGCRINKKNFPNVKKFGYEVCYNPSNRRKPFDLKTMELCDTTIQFLRDIHSLVVSKLKGEHLIIPDVLKNCSSLNKITLVYSRNMKYSGITISSCLTEIKPIICNPLSIFKNLRVIKIYFKFYSNFMGNFFVFMNSLWSHQNVNKIELVPIDIFSQYTLSVKVFNSIEQFYMEIFMNAPVYIKHFKINYIIIISFSEIFDNMFRKYLSWNVENKRVPNNRIMVINSRYTSNTKVLQKKYPFYKELYCRNIYVRVKAGVYEFERRLDGIYDTSSGTRALIM